MYEGKPEAMNSLKEEATAPDVAIVTGGASGIGAAVAQRLSSDGYTVLIGDVNVGEDSEKVSYQLCDVSDESQVAELIRQGANMGKLKVLVNCAGIGGQTAIEKLTMDEWEQMAGVNITGTLMAIKHSVSHMRETGNGAIVNIASTGAFRISSEHKAHYAATKGAVVALTKALVPELAEQSIRINAIAPGYTKTALISDRGQDWYDERVSTVPMTRFAEPSEIANTVSYLVSDDASFVTGHLLTVDGGMTAAAFNSNKADHKETK